MSDNRNFGAVQLGTVDSPSGEGLLERIQDDHAALFMHVLSVANDLHLAYGTAIKRMSAGPLRQGMIELDQSHDQIRAELAEFVRALGDSPNEHGNLHGLWDRAKVVLAELRGDEGILQAMADNEEELASALREVRHMPGLPENAQEILERGIEMERTHRSFYDRALGRFVG